MKVIKKQLKCKECRKPIKESKYSEYYKCPRHKKYYCNDCVQAGIRCKTCQTYLGSIWGTNEPQYKNLHINVKAALVLMAVSVIAFILIFIILFLFTPLTFLSGMIGQFVFIFFMLIALLILYSSDPLKNYFKRLERATEDRTLINLYSGLNGAWQNPIMSKDDRMRFYNNAHRNTNILIFNIIILGILLIIISYLLFFSIVLVFMGSLLISGGIVFAFYFPYLKIKFIKTEPLETFVILKTYKIEKANKIIDNFLKHLDEPYQKLLSSTTALYYLWLGAIKFEFKNKNYLILGSQLLSGLNPDVTVGIGYYNPDENIKHARELQKKLDRYLVKKEIVRLYR
jgi:hypothetical protein